MLTSFHPHNLSLHLHCEVKALREDSEVIWWDRTDTVCRTRTRHRWITGCWCFPTWTRCLWPTLRPLRAAAPAAPVRWPAPCGTTWAPTSMCWKRSTCDSAAFWPKFTSWKGGISYLRVNFSRLWRDSSTATFTPVRLPCRRTERNRDCRAPSGALPTSGGKGSALRPCKGPEWRGCTRTESGSK